MTARMSFIRSSIDGGSATGSDIPVPRLSNTINRENDASRLRKCWMAFEAPQRVPSTDPNRRFASNNGRRRFAAGNLVRGVGSQSPRHRSWRTAQQTPRSIRSEAPPGL
jgi:hypothetical protein